MSEHYTIPVKFIDACPWCKKKSDTGAQALAHIQTTHGFDPEILEAMLVSANRNIIKTITMIDAQCGYCKGQMHLVDATENKVVYKCENRADDPEEKKHSILTFNRNYDGRV